VRKIVAVDVPSITMATWRSLHGAVQEESDMREGIAQDFGPDGLLQWGR
jgi:hypothetical protein